MCVRGFCLLLLELQHTVHVDVDYSIQFVCRFDLYLRL